MLKRYTEEEKVKIVVLYQNGSTARELCEKYGMGRSSLYEWIKQNSELPVKIKSAREIYLLDKEVKRLRITNEILTNCNCSISSPLQDRLSAIERLKEKYSIHALCSVLDVNRSTFYNYSLRKPKKTMIQLQDEILKPLILEIFELSERRFGARKTRTKLIEKSYQISERRIHRLMKEMNLSIKSIYCYPNATFQRTYKYYSNKLKQQFSQEAPNLVWVSDITCVKVLDEICYLCVIIDLYSRKIISYSISNTPNTNFIIQALNRALKSRNLKENLLFHSDLGTQYTSFKFRSMLRQLNIKQSFSRAGTPYDNAVAESFFASINKEEFKRCYYESVEMLRVSVEKYIKFFNEYRPHQRLRYKTPAQVEKEFYDS